MRQIVNVLFLGGAKRVAMGRMFVEAGKRLGVEVVLFSYELNMQVPVSKVAHVIEGLKWTDPSLMDDLHRVVTDNNIDIIIPFVDPAIEVAARYCESNPKVFTPFNNPQMASMLFDKRRADELFRAINLPLPRNAELEIVEGEVIAKPRFGSASKGIKIMEADEFEATRSRGETASCLYQEYIAERSEFTVDCYVDRRGHMVCTVPRCRLEVSGGEVVTTLTITDHEIETLSRMLLKGLNLCGAVTVQFLRDRNNGHTMLMEVNPRLGGGAVCAVYAGADLPAFIIEDWLKGAVPACHTWKPGVKICRYLEDVVFMPD